MRKEYSSPELTTFGTVEQLTAGDGRDGIFDALAYLWGKEPDPWGDPWDVVGS